MNELGKGLVIAGVVLLALGLIFLFAGKLPWLGRLPGDIVIERERVKFYFPLATCLLLSAVLTLLLWLFRR